MTSKIREVTVNSNSVWKHKNQRNRFLSLLLLLLLLFTTDMYIVIIIILRISKGNNNNDNSCITSILDK